jgi:hypothetical protein
VALVRRRQRLMDIQVLCHCKIEMANRHITTSEHAGCFRNEEMKNKFFSRPPIPISIHAEIDGQGKCKSHDLSSRSSIFLLISFSSYQRALISRTPHVISDVLVLEPTLKPGWCRLCLLLFSPLRRDVDQLEGVFQVEESTSNPLLARDE